MDKNLHQTFWDVGEEDHSPIYVKVSDHVYRMLMDSKAYEKEESLKREIAKTINSHGYYKQRQGMLINENYLKWR